MSEDQEELEGLEELEGKLRKNLEEIMSTLHEEVQELLSKYSTRNILRLIDKILKESTGKELSSLHPVTYAEILRIVQDYQHGVLKL